MLPRRSMLAASPKNDAVKAPGETLEKSVTRSTPYSESMSALREAAARGVSCSVLPRPNTVSTGALDSMPNESAAPWSMRSASTMTCSMFSGSSFSLSLADCAFPASSVARARGPASPVSRRTGLMSPERGRRLYGLSAPKVMRSQSAQGCGQRSRRHSFSQGQPSLSPSSVRTPQVTKWKRASAQEAISLQ